MAVFSLNRGQCRTKISLFNYCVVTSQFGWLNILHMRVELQRVSTVEAERLQPAGVALPETEPAWGMLGI